jgi:hypothetical protein
MSDEFRSTPSTTADAAVRHLDNTERRHFLRLAGCAALAAAAISDARAAAAKLSEADPTASSLGYRQDGAQADPVKFPMRSPDQTCATCKLSRGSDGEWIPCTLYAGKLVNAKGWCAAWSKRDA